MESINDYSCFAELENDYEDDFLLKEEIDYENDKEISDIFIPKPEFLEMEMKYDKNEIKTNSNSSDDKSEIIHFLIPFIDLNNLNNIKIRELNNTKEKKEKFYIARKKRRKEIDNCAFKKEQSNIFQSFRQIMKEKNSNRNIINDKESFNESKNLIKSNFSGETITKNNIYFSSKKRDDINYFNNINNFHLMMDLDDDI